MRSILPHWLTGYRRDQLPNDLAAAIVVALLLVPQGLAYAALAGLPPQMGLYASLLPLVGYALFGSSIALSVGPVAVISLMVATALAPIAPAGSSEYILASLLLALLSGAMLFLFGLLRLGALAQLLSHPVISGFITGSALLIIIGQLSPLLGMEAHGNTAFTLLAGLAAASGQLEPLTAAVGVAALLILLASRLGLQALLVAAGMPATLASLATKVMPSLVVVGSAMLTAATGWEDRLPIVGTLTRGLPSLTWPSLDWPLLSQLWLPALILGLVGFVESVAIAQSLAHRQQRRINANAELRGLGAANMASALSGGFPVTGSFARSAANIEAGAQTPLAGLLAAGCLALILLFATELFRTLPMTILAATIISAVIGLADLKSLRQNWRYDRAEGLAQAGTAVGVLAAGVEAGIAIGIGLSLAALVWRASHPHIAIVGRVPDTEQFRNIRRYDVETRREMLLLRVDENLFFGNAEAVEQYVLKALSEQPETRHLILVMSSVSSIDATALEMLHTLNTQLAEQGIELHLAEVKGPVLGQLESNGFPDRLSGALHLSAHAAFEALRPREETGSD